MTIDEAIEKYKEITNPDTICLAHCDISCDECMQESEQLVEWLEELKAIKDGGISDGVCKWRLCNKEFIQNPHTKRIYSNKPNMKNVYCNTCGKKIEVVE